MDTLAWTLPLQSSFGGGVVSHSKVAVTFPRAPLLSFRRLHSAQRKTNLHLIWSRSTTCSGQSTSVQADSTDRTTVLQNAENSHIEQEIASTGSEDGWMETCDKLIEVFLVKKPNPSDWRKLLAFSKQWVNIRSHFYKRCRVRADMETDLDMKQRLLKLYRVLNEIDADMQKHDQLLNEIRKSPSEIKTIVGRRRKDFTVDFFEHAKLIANTYYDNVDTRDAVMRLAIMSWQAVQAHDKAAAGTEELGTALPRFEETFSLPSLEASSQSVDNFLGTNQTDPAVMSLLSKAWGFARDTTMTEEEAKDILVHLYKNTVINLQKSLPKEVRIIKYLLEMDDPVEISTALVDAFTPGAETQGEMDDPVEISTALVDDAFTPGAETQGEDIEMLYTTPRELHRWIKLLLDGYHRNTQKGIFMEAKLSQDPMMNTDYLLREARKLKKPGVIQKLESLKRTVEAKYL